MRALLTNYLNLVVGILTTLILTPFLVKTLGTEQFGLWNLTFSVLGVFGLLDLGFTNTLVRYVSESLGAKDMQRRDALASTMMTVFIIMSALATGGIWVISQSYQAWLQPSAGLERSAYQILWILGLRAVILQLPLSLFRSLLLCYQDFVFLNAVQSSFNILYAVGAWWILSHQGSIVDLAYLNLATLVGEYGFYVVRAATKLHPLRIWPNLASWAIFKEVFGYSAASFVTTIASFVLLRTDPLIVKSILTLDAVALYAVPLKISEYLLFLFKQCMDILTTRTAQLKGAKEEGKIRELFLASSRLSIVPATAVSIPVIWLAGPLLCAWVGPKMLEGANVLRLLALSTWLSVPQIVASGILSMSGHHRTTARAALIAAALNFGSSCFFAYKIGLPGVALGTLLTTLTVDIFLVVRAATVAYEISPFLYVRQVLLPLVLPTLGSLPLLLLHHYYFTVSDLPRLVVLCALNVMIFFVLYFLLSLNQQEKAYLSEAVLRKRAKQPTQPEEPEEPENEVLRQ